MKFTTDSLYDMLFLAGRTKSRRAYVVTQSLASALAFVLVLVSALALAPHAH